MKIIAIGRNYAKHAEELNNAVPSDPIIFLKPDTALIKNNNPFYHPSFSKDIQHEIEIQQKCKENGWPWELAKSFDHSAPVGNFISKKDFADISNINFQLNVNGAIKQKGNTKNMLFPFDKIISFVSQYITLKKGDLLFTGTPEGVSKIKIGDRLQGYLEDKNLLDFYIR